MSINNQLKPNWAIENFLEVRNNQLFISGVSAVELAQKFDTPLFVFSESRIRHNIDRLKKAGDNIGCPLKVCYAAKANSNMGILRAVRDAGSDLEVPASAPPDAETLITLPALMNTEPLSERSRTSPPLV